MKKIVEKYTPEQLRDKLISIFITGGESKGLRTEDIMRLYNVDYNDERTRDFITSKLRARDYKTA